MLIDFNFRSMRRISLLFFFWAKHTHKKKKKKKKKNQSFITQKPQEATMSSTSASIDAKSSAQAHNTHTAATTSKATAGAAETTLFDDSYTTLTNEGVTIHTYYFPIGLAKKFSWHEVESLEVSDHATMFSSKSWGSPDFVHWFGCHMWREFNRDLKKVVAFKLKESSIRPSVTPLQADEFIRICRQQIALARKNASASATPTTKPK
jgi:hypothetical protein